MIIEVQGISNTFKVRKRNAGITEAIKALFNNRTQEVKALDNISFGIKRGEIVGYIGPNGAGKSTSIKIMCGILTPDTGKCTVNELVPWVDRIENAKQIGVVFGQRTQLWWDLPVIDSFELLKEIYEIPKRVYEHNIRELDNALQIKSLITTPLRQLSLGQRMRCEFAAALLHSPKILFLDEPTIGLDTVSKHVIRAFIKKINKEYGVTVVLTTHDMQDIEHLATRIIFLRKGRVIFDGLPKEFKRRVLGDKVIKIIHDAVVLPPNKGLQMKSISDTETWVTFDSHKIPISEIIDYVNKCFRIRDITIADATIEDVIVQLYETIKE